MTPGDGERARDYISIDQTQREGYVKEYGYDGVASMLEQKMLAALSEAPTEIAVRSSYHRTYQLDAITQRACITDFNESNERDQQHDEYNFHASI